MNIKTSSLPCTKQDKCENLQPQHFDPEFQKEIFRFDRKRVVEKVVYKFNIFHMLKPRIIISLKLNLKNVSNKLIELMI